MKKTLQKNLQNCDQTPKGMNIHTQKKLQNLQAICSPLTITRTDQIVAISYKKTDG